MLATGKHRTQGSEEVIGPHDAVDHLEQQENDVTVGTDTAGNDTKRSAARLKVPFYALLRSH